MSDSDSDFKEDDNLSGGDSPRMIKRFKKNKKNGSSISSMSESVKKDQEYHNVEDENYSASQSDSSYKKGEKRSTKKFTKKKRNRDKKKKKRNAHKGFDYLDMQAEEDEDEDSVDGEITNEQQKKLMDQYDRNKQQNNVGINRMNDLNEDELINRYKEIDYPLDYLDPKDEIEHHALQPSISDPKLWMIKCKIGKERESVDTLFHKYFYYNKERDPTKIKILSVASFDSLKGYIYIEAYKEANVREAVMGVSTVRENTIKIVPINEMTSVFGFDKLQKIDIKPKQWVRMKSGMYEGDLAQVINIEDPINKIHIRIIPRISDQTNEPSMKGENIGDYNKKIKKNIKPRQKLFNQTHYSNIEKKTSALFGDYITWNKQMFKEGFLIKVVKAKSLLTESIVPKIEELKIFDLSRFNREDNEDNFNMTDLDYLSNTIQSTEINKKNKFAKGDRVRIIKGGLNSITGKVITHVDKTVQLVPNVEGMGEEILEFPEDYLVKEFLPGEIVQVVNGPNIGKQGCIVKIEENGDTAIIFSESTKSHYKVSCSDIVSSTQLPFETEQNSNFKIGDLVKINNTNLICYVLDVSKYSLKLIDTRNEIKTSSIRDVFRLTSNRINGIDSKKNPISKDDTVKVIAGAFKGVKGIIKSIYKYFVFLHNNEYISSNGMIVDVCENVEILGSELLIDNEGTRGKVNQKFIPENIRNLIGKTVKIILGVWKGYYGIVKDVTDKLASIELSSKTKTVRVELNMIQDMQNDNAFSNRYDNVTPRAMIQPKTPAYYPQSPHPNNAQSPKWNPNATRKYYNHVFNYSL